MQNPRYEEQAKADKARYDMENAQFKVSKDAVEKQRKALDAHFHEQKIAAALAFYDEHATKEGCSTAVARKPKASKSDKDCDAPKGARSAYLLYASERRLQLTNADLAPADILKRVAADWKKLNASTAKKNVSLVARFHKLAEEDRARYEREKVEYVARKERETAERQKEQAKQLEETCAVAMREYLRKMKEEQIMRDAVQASKEEKRRTRELKKAKKEAREAMPKKARSAYILFSSAMRGELVENNPNMRPPDVMRELGAMWRKADAATKKYFESKASADKARYDEEMIAYNARTQ